MNQVEIFADGGCRGNPGIGGFGTILRYGEHVKEFSGGDNGVTTNNRMELMAVITGFEALNRPSTVVVTTDSAYVCKAFTEKWLAGWVKKGWVNSKREPVANKDLWERLMAAMKGHTVSWQWVKGHNGHPENERCDRLANQWMDQCK